MRNILRQCSQIRRRRNSWSSLYDPLYDHGYRLTRQLAASRIFANLPASSEQKCETRETTVTRLRVRVRCARGGGRVVADKDALRRYTTTEFRAARIHGFPSPSHLVDFNSLSVSLARPLENLPAISFIHLFARLCPFPSFISESTRIDLNWNID